MADQPSITSILAALAAQRPTNTPPQPQQASYQPPPQQQPSYTSASYALPQPSNSGSVDLSSIKPVNSGTVSIAEAIAKAKAIAAEKGVSYDRPASYGANLASARPYRETRSRSRSPPPARREAFRDNYNPYRDERRGDRAAPPARDPYGRERSYSPARRGPLSPPRNAGYQQRDRSPPGRGGDRGGDSGNVETISIESNLVGLIIGRQGENLRRVESETGCRVQFITGPEEGSAWRQCKITGPPARRADAIAEINRIIDDSGMGSGAKAGGDRGVKRQGGAAPRGDDSHQPPLKEGEDSMQIMVPDRTVGLIIGRGGETIRDLQERSGCHVNIVGEQKSVNGLRPVNLIGTPQAAAKAKDLIMEIVESDSKSAASKDRAPAQRDSGRDMGYGGGGGGGGDGKINDQIFVPSEAVGMIIGKGGETIKDIQATSGCKVNVSPSSGPGEVERQIGLIGTRDAIERAKQAIMDKVEAVQMKNSGGGGRRQDKGSQQLDYGDRSYQQSSYGAAQSQPTQAPGAGAAGAEDPYAAYGGYQAYVALWYQAMAAQQQAGQPQGDPTKPPGTA